MNLFKLNSPISRFLELVFDLALLNILFLITSIPIFTIGAGVKGMYKVTLAMVKDEEGPIFKYYLKGFKESFMRSTFVWIMFLIFGCVLMTDAYYYVNGYITNFKIPMLIFLCLALCIGMMLLDWTFVILAKFKVSKNLLLKNALLFTIRYLPFNLLFSILTILWVFIIISLPYLWFMVILIGFSVPIYMKSIFYRKKIQPFIDRFEEDNREISREMSI